MDAKRIIGAARKSWTWPPERARVWCRASVLFAEGSAVDAEVSTVNKKETKLWMLRESSEQLGRAGHGHRSGRVCGAGRPCYLRKAVQWMRKYQQLTRKRPSYGC